MSLKRRSPIGIEVGARSIGAVQLDGSSSRVVAAAIVSRRPSADGKGHFGPEEASRLESILYRQGFAGEHIVLCVPDGKLMTAVLELPPRSSGAPVEQLARVELARTHKKDPASFEMACWDVPPPARANDATHLMAAACAHEDAIGFMDIFESAGFYVKRLDVKPWALTRACGPVLGSEGTTALLDLGETGAMFAAIRNGVPAYERLMHDSGLGMLRTRVQTELGLEPDIADFLLESLGRASAPGEDSGARESASRLLTEHLERLCVEVRTALDYTEHRYPGPLHLLGVMGVGAALPGVVDLLSKTLESPVRLLSPAELAQCPDSLACCRDPGLTGALGLARTEMRRAA